LRLRVAPAVQIPTQIASEPRNSSVFCANKAIRNTITADPAKVPRKR